MKSKKASYDEKARQLAAAIDIAVEIYGQFVLLSPEQTKHVIDVYLTWKVMALNPNPGFKKIASLKYLESDCLTYWNESAGPHVELFWERIANEKLGFKRKDVLKDVLKRNRIKNIFEFDSITDSLVISRQTGKIDEAEFLTLSQLLGDFEKRQIKKS